MVITIQREHKEYPTSYGNEPDALGAMTHISHAYVNIKATQILIISGLNRCGFPPRPTAFKTRRRRTLPRNRSIEYLEHTRKSHNGTTSSNLTGKQQTSVPPNIFRLRELMRFSSVSVCLSLSLALSSALAESLQTRRKPL